MTLRICAIGHISHLSCAENDHENNQARRRRRMRGRSDRAAVDARRARRYPVPRCSNALQERTIALARPRLKDPAAASITLLRAHDGGARHSARRRASRSSPIWVQPIRWRRRRLTREIALCAGFAGPEDRRRHRRRCACRRSGPAITGSRRPAARSAISATASFGQRLSRRWPPLRDALAAGADVVIAGQVADPALFLRALLPHEFRLVAGRLELRWDAAR